MNPVIQFSPADTPPQGTALGRACTALLVERRLPGPAARAFDRAALALGIPHKTVRARGLSIRVRRSSEDTSYVRNVLEGREYNPAGFEIGPADTVVDVGGNIGSFAMLAALEAPRGRVVTVEPVRSNFDLLCRNIASNGLGNVQPIHAAVLDKPGEAKVFLNNGGSGYHSIHSYRGTDPSAFEVVAAVTLPDLFDNLGIERCQFLKLDCEGAEFPILFGLPTDFFGRIEKIAMEYHTSSKEARRAEGDLLVALLERVGYHIDAYVEFAEFRGGLIRARRPR